MNMQFWDDVELVYNNVYEMCEGLYNQEGQSNEFLRELYDLLNTAEESAIGVQEEHSERINQSLYTKLQKLKEVIVQSISKNEYIASDGPPTKIISKDDYRNLSIFPTKEDLLNQSLYQIQPNIINSAYSSVEHYLDIQFKLLREDCFGPLREGICRYLENPTKRRHENIRVYPKVRIIQTYISNNKVGHLIDLAWDERANHRPVDRKNYAYNKHLMFGSLLLFTSDNFKTILCATVLDSSLNLLNDGYIAVSFKNAVANNIFSEQFLMVESEVFFEPYHRVLKVLQNCTEDLPMKKYIVDVLQQTNAPSYINSDTVYNIHNEKGDDIYVPVLDPSQWPSPELLNLDESQMDAYNFALTREFAVIQGPPGTGKTYLGIKIASTLLKNLSLEGTPMLVICYTNHALDQFLEGILNVTNNIIRLGSQSKSKILEPYTLNNVKARNKSRFSYLYASKRSELEKVFNEMTELQSLIEKCGTDLLSYRTIKPYLKEINNSFELKSYNEDSVLDWLFGHLEKKESIEIDDWEKQMDEIVLTDKIDSCFSEEWALKEIDSMNNSIKFMKNITDKQIDRQNMINKFESQIEKIRKRLDCFKINMKLQTSGTSKIVKLDDINDLYDLSLEERWNIYFQAVDNVKKQLIIKMNVLLNKHNALGAELEEVSTLIDSDVMKTARVVGVTTTVAARRHDLMRKLLSSIVIVEEAAEVLEAHIVASLTNKCQHLILIGDHKQLRPSAAHYKLAKHYNLEISLFERMIRNGIHAKTLTIQRRMRPNFVELLVPTIYEKLDCHPIVFKYPKVRGMKDTLYFYNHDVFEDSEGLEDSWSHKNTFEANWCVGLANYLLQMEYKSNEVTILTTYTGQATLIKELTKKFTRLRDIKITVVDNFQGEESKIVILSLVRSNRDGNIGFLAAANRICVALSRAKEGFYIFGNMNGLKSASSIWRSIAEKLSSRNAIGRTIELYCEKHAQSIGIDKYEDLNNCLKGMCYKNCKVISI
ncbi:NFX1-type zinc finger-containing protein 1-like isoform X2 [Zerene cesonia]|nr:NFX1-type zinc finger-containing protein 1-like isoform X2 [Zerene cesonia]